MNEERQRVAERSLRMLRAGLGTTILRWLDEPMTAEIMVNPDGWLWVDHLERGMLDTDEKLAPEAIERIVRAAAHHVGAEVHRDNPLVSAELPASGERFEGALPPVVPSPCFSIRKPSRQVLALQDYVDAGIMRVDQAVELADALSARANILVAGATSSGKTTLVNALLGELAGCGERLVLIEDMRELQCRAANHVSLRTSAGVDMTRLVRSTLRLRPDRIVVGEVRGSEALDLVKAWGTGHPGGIGTIHAGTAMGALLRLEQLILEAAASVPRALVAETVDVIAVLVGRGRERRLTELVRVAGLDAAGTYCLTPLVPETHSGEKP